jgi:hypothetical protein
MTRWLVILILVAIVVILGSVTAVMRRRYRKPITLQGAIIQFSDDTNRQSPIAGVEVGAFGDLAPAATMSDFSGFFSLTLYPRVKRGEPITLTFRHPDYLPLNLNETVGDALSVVHMAPVHHDTNVSPNPTNHPGIVIGNVIVRYSIETLAAENIGSGVKVFQVANTANVPCNHGPVCSPDNRWKAATGSASLDAGAGNEFRNARVSCIAGPCPFTRINSDRFSAGGRSISVSIRDWSDTTTFVLQAEVFHVQVNDIVRQYYPIIIGRTLNFTLPAAASGLRVEAELNGIGIDSPLGPDPVLSWADCRVSTEKDRTRVYRCELKPWCQFR